MLQKLKREWRRFFRRQPGTRFTERYYEKHRRPHSTAHTVGVTAAGLLLIIVGIVLLAAPGPGTVLVLIGASLIAQEWLAVARALDAAELRLRSFYAESRRLWQCASPAIKVLLAICAFAIATALAFGAYTLAIA